MASGNWRKAVSAVRPCPAQVAPCCRENHRLLCVTAEMNSHSNFKVVQLSVATMIPKLRATLRDNNHREELLVRLGYLQWANQDYKQFLTEVRDSSQPLSLLAHQMFLFFSRQLIFHLPSKLYKGQCPTQQLAKVTPLSFLMHTVTFWPCFS